MEHLCSVSGLQSLVSDFRFVFEWTFEMVGAWLGGFTLYDC